MGYGLWVWVNGMGYGYDLFTDATDSDFHDGLTGEDKNTFKKTLRRKKRFLSKPRDTTVPILQRCQTQDRLSQKCQIVRMEEEGEGEGCSGNSRGLKNVALTIDNAAVDQYASKFYE